MSFKNKTTKTRSIALTLGARVRFLVRMLVGLIALGWSGWNMYFGIDSMAWPSAEAKIQSIKSPTSYVYYVDGRQYQGSLIRFGDSCFFDSSPLLKKFVDSGYIQRAYYNPDMPTMACMINGYNKMGVYLPLAIGLFCVTVAGLELRARYLIR